MNKTVFEAVKAWVKGIIGKVERRIKAVEKDVQTINRKLPNFLTPNYTTDKDINLIRQHVVSRLVHLEWKLDAELDYSRGADFYCNGFLDWGFDNSQVLFYKTNAAGETEGSYSYAFSYHEEDRPVVVFSSNAWESEGYSYPAGWSGLDFNTDTMQPLTEPPTLFLVEWDDPAFVDEVLPQIATLVEEKYEDYVASETYLHADGSDIRLEYSKDDFIYSRVKVGTSGVQIYDNNQEVARFGDNGHFVTRLDDPELADDAANKRYVDGKLTLADGAFMQNGVDVTADVKAALGIE